MKTDLWLAYPRTRRDFADLLVLGAILALCIAVPWLLSGSAP